MAIGLLGSEVAAACSCARDIPFAPGFTPAPDARARWAQEQMRLADAAVVGRLLDVRLRRGLAHSRYRIGAVYKGGRRLRRGQIVTVRSAGSPAACGLPQEVGRRHGLLLYRRRGHPRWHSGLCSLMSASDMRLGLSAKGARAGRRDVGPPVCF
ncbi:MAG: hypothetical protein M3131_05215 [Actinomycetota bacterium]|nr:hypothetical protein [Actinomycetota bacterium]